MVKVLIDIPEEIDQFLRIQQGVLRISDKRDVMIYFLERAAVNERNSTPPTKLRKFIGL